MYIPKNWHLFRALGISMVGFYVMRRLEQTYDVVTFFFVFQLAAISDLIRWLVAGLLYQAYLTRFHFKEIIGEINEALEHHQEKKGSPRKSQAAPVGFVPLVRTVKPSYAQTVAPVKIDRERSFAVALVRMYEFDPKTVDLREGKWVKSGKFSRTAFIDMLENWKVHGIIERKNDNKNSSYVVVKWPAVRAIAEGHPLPPPPK